MATSNDKNLMTNFNIQKVPAVLILYPDMPPNPNPIPNPNPNPIPNPNPNPIPNPNPNPKQGRLLLARAQLSA